MKKFLLTLGVALLAVINLNAQKVGYIETETILSHISEYKVAQSKLEVLSNQYKKEIESKYSVIESLYQKYQSQKASLSQSARGEKENEIIAKEREVKALEKKYFGQGGDMQKKSEELLSPIKARVNAAIEKVAQEGNYSIIFDISALQGVVYTKESDNLSNAVLAKLGY